MPGRFIVLEGIDGSGSTTQAKLLVERLQRKGSSALFTCEPSSGSVGQLIRAALTHALVDTRGGPVTLDWVTMALLFAADRADHVDKTLLPALRQGAVVVCDRYDLSSLAYQSLTSGEAVGPSAALPWIRELNRHVPRPDLTLVIDVDPALAERRRRARGSAAELFEVPEIQRKLAELYRRGEELVPGDRVVHIDGSLGIQEVGEAIWAAVRALVGR